MKVIIVGSGLGGLSTALRLSSQGYEVEMVESYHQPGGRLNRLVKQGFEFDVGPSFFSMSYEFDELFTSCGIQNPLRLLPLDPLYAVYFRGREKPFLIHRNPEKLSETFQHVESDFENKLKRYLQQAEKIFHDTEYTVIKRNHTSILNYLLALATVPPKHATGMFTSMWRRLETYFDSEEVKVIFSLVAFFLGNTPFQTPAVYSLLNYMELKHDGYWNVEGGMYSIVTALVKLLSERNVKIHFNTTIEKFESLDGKVTGLLDQHGKKWEADIYVVNADAAAFRHTVFQRKKYNEQKLNSMKWTLAPLTIYLGVEGSIPALHHHSYFLGNNFREYSRQIFQTEILPKQPYYYVNTSSKSNLTAAPAGCENIFILCPVPDLRFKKEWNDAEEIADEIISDLSARVHFPLHEKTITRTVYSPVHWRNQFHLYQGSGLGLAHGMNQVGAFRPANADEVFANVFYVGASTVPGTGLPMVVISSKLVTERIHRYASTIS